ncbi:C-GCAxxG-C-C family protein [Moorella sulfitireducens (nom. illeg.)]|uniref:C-GCAxxG-C-C family protein n=1 Tax=Neomoorella sulfitireducens TaxID=2972948 RepID=UPI0021AC3F6B|nr:C-GCAxxG-C-C family protein [Moorella sulfitireducens]
MTDNNKSGIMVLNGERVTVPSPQGTGLVVPPLPWPYKKLDPEVVRRRGYELCFEADNCMYGSGAALLLTLQEEIGFPYTCIPADMFRYGAGGGVGWGSLCGALNGSGAIIALVCKDYFKVFRELIIWYTGFAFPSDKHEAYCKYETRVRTVAYSPLCSDSLFKWGAETKESIRSEIQKDRCSKVVGDTAAKTVEMLNALFGN